MRYWKPKPIKDTRVGIAVAACFIEGSGSLTALKHLVAAFELQTFNNWHMHVMHDGPLTDVQRDELGFLQLRTKGKLTWDQRPRLQKHGHPHRQAALDYLTLHHACEWLLCTNADNYYAPVFLEALLDAGQRGDADAVYCDMIHSHKMWQPLRTAFKYQHLDLGGFIVRDRLARKVPFDNFAFNGDGDWINRLAAAASSPKRIVKVPAFFFVHN